MHWTILLQEDRMRTPHTSPQQFHLCLVLLEYNCKRALFIRRVDVLLIKIVRYELYEPFAGNMYLIVTLIGHEYSGIRPDVRRGSILTQLHESNTIVQKGSSVLIERKSV